MDRVLQGRPLQDRALCVLKAERLRYFVVLVPRSIDRHAAVCRAHDILVILMFRCCIGCNTCQMPLLKSNPIAHVLNHNERLTSAGACAMQHRSPLCIDVAAIVTAKVLVPWWYQDRIVEAWCRPWLGQTFEF